MQMSPRAPSATTLGERMSQVPDDSTRKPQDSQSAAESESEATTREEMIDTLLHPDRAKHDELGRTEGGARHQAEQPSPTPGPREQPAAPIDVSNVDE
jgi:hypothetical protein